MTTISAVPSELLLGAGIEAIYAGVDWLSCTLPSGSSDEDTWHLGCIHTIKEVERGGEILKAGRLNGYDGWRVGGSFFGYRHDGAYLQLSGHRASDFLDTILRDDLHISRIDIQTTVKYRVYAPGVGTAVLKSSIDANGALPKARQRKIWYMAGNDGGYTCYIGAPTSEQRAKVYNKAVQSSDPLYDRCWRWEVTAKNAYAGEWFKAVTIQADKRPQVCASIVASWFALRGAKPEWSAYVPLITMPLIKEIPTDADRRLRWLKEQVKPAYQWLVENGFASEANEALGIGTSEELAE